MLETAASGQLVGSERTAAVAARDGSRVGRTGRGR